MNGIMAPQQGPQEVEQEEVEQENEAGDQEGEESNLSPEAEKDLGLVLDKLDEIIHGEKGGKLVAAIKAGRNDLGQTMGQLAAKTIIAIEQALEQGGEEIEDDIIPEAITFACGEMYDIAEAAGLAPEDDEAFMQGTMKEAVMAGMAVYGQTLVQLGKMDQAEAQDRLAEMLKSGEGGEVGQFIAQSFDGADFEGAQEVQA